MDTDYYGLILIILVIAYIATMGVLNDMKNELFSSLESLKIPISIVLFSLYIYVVIKAASKEIVGQENSTQ